VKVVLAGGGTGGHVYPSLSVARALESRMRDEGRPLELLYVGVRGRIDETIVPAEGIAFEAVDAGQLRVSSPLTFARNVFRLARGVFQSVRILRRFRPDVVFATGGYASVPVGVAARLLRKPLVVFLPDVTPGWAVRLLSRLATRMTTTSERALDHLPRAKAAVVGYPVRDAFWSTDRAAARASLGLPLDAKVLLVTAGSLGARRINEAIWPALPRLLDRCAVLHVTGAADESAAIERRATLAPEQQARYVVRGYLPDMPAAMVAADLVISRSGASTLGELPAAGVPAILVPGEYEGWSQAPNAEFLQSEGAAVMLRNADIGRLAATAQELLADDARLAAMREAMKKLARPDAASDLARILVEVAA
jgi:UDP-N-acetylglucosamine--N-acetylmuramyl-(pentapeptide) pyrophosphoryl-undecaprenol N-acetylglucosamine transferase